jgi:recombination protein RecA
MALPAAVLARLPPAFLRSGLLSGGVSTPETGARMGLPLGIEALDGVLPDRGLFRGGVVELAVSGGALGTSIALAACHAAQDEARRRGGDTPYCAFVDPSGTLYAPGVAQAGIVLERLLVVRPPLEALSRVALKLVESQAFAVTIIDTVGIVGAALDVSLTSFTRSVRRFSLAVEGSAAVVLLITDAKAPRPLPLPVAMRLELGRPELDRLVVRVAKDRQGRVGPVRSVCWPPVRVASAGPPNAVVPAARYRGAAHG